MSLPRSLLLAALLTSTTASAQPADPLAPLPPAVLPVQVHRPPVQTGFEAYKQQLAAKARAAGIREATIANVIPYLTVDYRVIRLDRGQPGQVTNTSYTPPFAPYRRLHVTDDLIRRGQSNYSALWPYLSRIERQYGVPASMTLAIWGKETSYGQVKGTYDVLRVAREPRLRRTPPPVVRDRIRRRHAAHRPGHFPLAAARQLRRRDGPSAIHADQRPSPARRRRRRRRPGHLGQPARRTGVDRQLPARRRLARRHVVGGSPCGSRPASTGRRCAI